MIHSVYSYILEGAVGVRQTIDMGAGPILSVEAQRDLLSMWALVDPHRSSLRRTFILYLTGHDIHAADQIEYRGSARARSYMWHVFEVTSEYVTAESVKVVRVRCDASMRDARRALIDCYGDVEAACELVRQRGV